MNFENIFKENYLYIYNFALKLSCHPQDAEDLTQQTFMTAFEKENQLKDEKALKKWLASICYRHFLMFARSRGVTKESDLELEELETAGKILTEQFPQADI